MPDMQSDSNRPSRSRGRHLRLYFRYFLSFFLARTPLCAVRRHTSDGFVVITKTRHFFANLFVSVGNFFLWWQGEGARALHLKMWQERELAVARIQPWRKVTLGRGSVTQVVWPGTSLDEFLAMEQLSSARCSAIRSAFDTLTELHIVRAPDERFFAEGFSHGDATSRNVVFDQGTGRAIWIDFDLAHIPARSHEWRRADDVRAFLTSVARHLSLPEFLTIAAECLGPISSDGKHSLRQILERAIDNPSSFQMAQTQCDLLTFLDVHQSLLTLLWATEPASPNTAPSDGLKG